MGNDRYSIFSLLRESLRGHIGWQPAWREPEPKPAYDVLVVGGGGHGLATAYYLASRHGITNVAVLEKGWIGSGNVGRNTTIVRSNYLLPGNIPFYELSLKLWEGLEQDINYNAMVSQRGVLNLYHSDGQRDAYGAPRQCDASAWRGCGNDGPSMRVRQMLPFLNFDDARFPIQGGLMQRRGGTARHDAVAWGYARARRSARRGHHCKTAKLPGSVSRTADRLAWKPRAASSARTNRFACAGNSSRVASLAGLRLPIESHVLQAFVSEGLKPLVRAW